MSNFPQKVLVTGASGYTGEHLTRRLVELNSSEKYQIVGTTFTNNVDIAGATLIPVDLRDQDAVRRLFRDLQPDVVFHCAAVTDVGFCQREPESAKRGIVGVMQNVLSALDTMATPARLITLSSDMVFDGEKGMYQEGDATSPKSVYAEYKLEADELVLNSVHGQILRTALIFGLPSTHHGSFLAWMFKCFAKSESMTLFFDEIRTPVYVDDLVKAMIELSEKTPESTPRLINIGGDQALSRHDMGHVMCDVFGLESSIIKSVSLKDSDLAAMRPADVSLNCSLFHQTFCWTPRSFVSGIQAIKEFADSLSKPF